MNFITPKQLIEKIDNLAKAIGTAIRELRAKVGDVASLSTTEKTSVVEAINEVNTIAKAANSKTAPTVEEMMPEISGGLIQDEDVQTHTTYSSRKIEDIVDGAVERAKRELIDGAENTYDTLKEIQEIIKSDKTVTAGLLESVGNRLRVDEKMTLTETQEKALSETLGFVDKDFVATFNAHLNPPGVPEEEPGS